MDPKNDTLSEVIDFVTNGEDSWNADSDDEEEEIVILLPIERAEAELIATVISQMTKTKDLLNKHCQTKSWWKQWN